MAFANDKDVHVICFGDAPDDIEAIQSVTRFGFFGCLLCCPYSLYIIYISYLFLFESSRLTGVRMKSVKLLQRPSVKQLRSQLRFINHHFHSIHGADGELSVSVNSVM